MRPACGAGHSSPMDDVILLENLCADAWPAVAEEPLGQWRLRAAGGFTGRANSVLTTGDPGLPVRSALGRAIGFARTHNIKPAAHVTMGSAIERDLAGAGWVVDVDHPGGAESLVLTGCLQNLHRPESRAMVLTEPTPRWWELTTGSPEPTPAQRRVLAGGDKVGFGLIGDAGAVRGAVVGDLLHIARLAVSPENRRAGLATELLAALAEWASEQGATRCVLQVAEHNTAALRLYYGLGCVEHHRYRYWTPAG